MFKNLQIVRVRQRMDGWYMVWLVEFADGFKMRIPRIEGWRK